jgi:hypothetical protein
VRFAANDAAADGQVRDIEIHRERVVLRRSLRGMQRAISMPVSAFAGVVLKVMLSDEGWTAETVAAVLLAHKDPSLMLPLLVTPQVDDALVEWRRWSHALGLPLLVDDESGLHEPFTHKPFVSKFFVNLGQLRIARQLPRRRRRTALKRRRPSIPLRRSFAKLTAAASVYRGEREIIVRD